MSTFHDFERKMMTEIKLYSKLTAMPAYKEISVKEVSESLERCDYDPDKALALIMSKNTDSWAVSPEYASAIAAVKRTTTSIGGARVSVEIGPEDQTEPRVSDPVGLKEGLQETPVLVPETPMDSETLERVEKSEIKAVVDEAEPRVSAQFILEGVSQETPILVPEIPLDSQTLESVEELGAAVEVKEESNVELEEHAKSPVGDSSQPEGESETKPDVPEVEMADIVQETPLESQPVEPVADTVKAQSICKLESEAAVEVQEESKVHLEDSIKPEGGSEVIPGVPEVEMVDIVQETPLESQPVEAVVDEVKAESICKLESDAPVEVKEETNVQLQLSVKPEVEIVDLVKSDSVCILEPQKPVEEPEVQSKYCEPKKEVLDAPKVLDPALHLKQKFQAWEERKEKGQTQRFEQKKPVEVKKEVVDLVVDGIEKDGFPTVPDYLFIGDAIVTATSTTKRRRIEDNEIVEFEFPLPNPRYRAPPIVRLRNKRLGEIGRLPMEWSRCLIPLVQSNIVKVHGKCVNGPVSLEMMREITLYMGFYAHKNFFAEREKRISMKLAGNSIVESNMNPLRSLFQLLKIQPCQEALCTADDLENRKQSQNPNVRARMEELESSLVKRRKVSTSQAVEVKQDQSEQAISEAALNKLIGTVEVYNLEEMEPPSTLMCDLRAYQKQALHWMSTLESVTEASKTLHPCWAAYQIKDENPVYVNVFSGEMTTKMPSATESARGGILADAMGLGKTVMTIALILARPGKGIPEEKKTDASRHQSRVKGGTLIICPMALLGQWKDELDTHSEPDSLSVYVQYGAERTNDPRVISKHDVVLTTYNLISNAFRKDGMDSIYYKIDWHRIVLDEAHTIKAWKTQTAQSIFALSSHCRWCLTGTPLQNNLEDLFSLICFLKVEPWCNWTCWRDQIQKPYESGDPRGLSWVKALLKPLMLRRTKETKDKDGRLILSLPPTDVRLVVCEQSEAENDFYMALFKRSKVQFDQFVAQGKVMNNYANILELLLRLRQCCNHPFLVMSRADSDKYADLDKLAQRFTGFQNSEDLAPSRAFVEEVVEGIRRGETAECPICLESPDDPVLTPCAHRMCRECLFKCWRTSSSGACPICRNEVKKTDLITCPSEGRFRVDVEKNWNESAKVSKLLQCLEDIRESGSGEKSIVFSQWTAFLDLLEIPLKRRGFGFLRFDGKLSQKQRYSVLKEFDETRHKTVLLMSLKAGGVGLNLTAASNVFLMDPWWNPAVEEQAIMRIHRIGQKRTVIVRRFIVKDTVEDRLEQVKLKKQQMIAGALTDGEVRSTRLEDLKMLFR